MCKFKFHLLTALLTFGIGVLSVSLWMAKNHSLVATTNESKANPTNTAETRQQFNGELEAKYIGSYQENGFTIDRFLVVNNTPASAIYRDFGVYGAENQTMTWLRKKKSDKPQYVGKGFCLVGLENINPEKELLPGESKLFEVENFPEKKKQHEIGFSFKVGNNREDKIIWATLEEQKILPE